MQLIDTQKDAKKKLKALEIVATINVYIILEFLGHTFSQYIVQAIRIAIIGGNPTGEDE